MKCIEFGKNLIEMSKECNHELIDYVKTNYKLNDKYVFKYLIDKNIKDERGLSIIEGLIIDGYKNIMYLLKSMNDDRIYKDEVLLISCLNKNMEIFKYLINERKIDVNYIYFEDEEEMTIGDFNIIYSNLEMFKILLEKGIKAEYSKNSYLINASANNNIEIVKYLVEEKKVDINYTNDDNNSALMFSCRRNHIEIVKYLIDKGARTDIRNICDEENALEIACLKGNTEIVKYIINNDKYKIPKFLINKYKEVMKSEECAICLEKIEKDKLEILNNCGHMYHKECITRWSKNCPLCKKDII